MSGAGKAPDTPALFDFRDGTADIAAGHRVSRVPELGQGVGDDSGANPARSGRRPKESDTGMSAASIVQRWFGAPGEDPLLVRQRATGERPEAAEALLHWRS